MYDWLIVYSILFVFQEEKMVKYKTRLRDLNVEVSEDEAEDEDLTWPSDRYGLL